MNEEHRELEALLEISNQAWLEFIAECPTVEDLNEILKPCTDEEFLKALQEFWRV